MNGGRRMMLENTNQGGVLHMEREATGPIAVQLLKHIRDKYIFVIL
jgi:hypothetical protein